MKGRAKIDPIDLRIIELLSKNARMTYKELAEALGTTRQRISRRMEKLERMGVIQKYTVVPNFDLLGYSYVLLGITLKAGVSIDEAIGKLKEVKHVTIIQKALGTHNLVVHVVAPKDMKEIQAIIEEISKAVPGVEHMDVTFITETCKYELF
ncbi:Lrp/AsnC family transcriptional regulator [Thermococcus waiotapuensis]|uniref:Lrp/AsnC family transcriptional regulator n=1 Tax=Thermococcus waiotapuensis TaxID=90909 RepID=A0AAE4NWM3_9EURY|nr:Lrp/AsnC family transcriptional regulator [Thermococcus waiotapuensis]MDV3104040.1 Lrp/AsnC family transcriptional regulator [Thermococcus waiotapuensis]